MKKNLPIILVACAAVFFFLNVSTSLSSKKKKVPTKISWVSEKAKVKRPMVVILPSARASKEFQRSLDSIFDQNYPDIQVIAVADTPLDVRIDTKKSLFEAIQSCEDNEVLVFLPVGDRLSHEKVLKHINRAYEDESVWMTYGSCIDSPSYRNVHSKEIPDEVHEKGNYRSAAGRRFLVSRLQTGYAALFKKVSPEHYFDASLERSIMLPAVEMAGKHALFVPDILCIRASKEAEDLEFLRKFQAMTAYEPLEGNPF